MESVKRPTLTVGYHTVGNCKESFFVSNNIDNYDRYVEGTSLQGYIHISYKDLCSILGNPLIDVDSDGKTRVAWVLVFFDDVVIRIYDWKAECPVKDVGVWHIGGKTSQILVRILNITEEKYVVASEEDRKEFYNQTILPYHERIKVTCTCNEEDERDNLDDRITKLEYITDKLTNHIRDTDREVFDVENKLTSNFRNLIESDQERYKESRAILYETRCRIDYIQDDLLPGLEARINKLEKKVPLNKSQ